MYIPFTSKYEPKVLRDFRFPPGIHLTLAAVGTKSRLNTLLVGPRGTGKTSIAKAIGRTIGVAERDILSINNVSENGINFFRNDVRTFCKSNATCKKRLVIIDDIDIVNEQSQQVLRSTIDAFAHITQFIATATSKHRIVDGLVSRFTTINIPRIENEGMVSIMDNILAQESTSIGPDVCKFVLSTCNRCPRTLLSTLDKLCLVGGPMSLEQCKRHCVAVDFTYYERLIQAVQANSSVGALDIADDMCAHGYSPLDILDGFFHALRLLPTLSDIQKYEATKITARYVGTCHSCNTDRLHLRLFVLEIFNVIKR
jgi:DNA polymerase III gamma/tau subunit